MKKRIIALVVAFALAFNPLLAGAVTYYVQTCDTGSDVGCVAGSDSNNGTSPSTPWKTWWGVDFSGMAADTTVKFAQGGAFIINVRTTVTVTAGTPCKINFTSHGLRAGTTLTLVTSGTMPTGTGIAGTSVGVIVKTVLDANSFSFSYGPQSSAFSCSDGGTGTFTVTTMTPNVVNMNTSAAHPLTFDSYAPTAWTSSGNLPKIISQYGNDALDFSPGGSATVDGGYVIKNLAFSTVEGGWANNSNNGIRLYNEVDDVTLDNVDISNFAIGVLVQGHGSLGAGANGAQNRFTLRNSNIHDNSSQGLLGGGPDMLVENNRFDNNGYAGSAGVLSKAHNIYIADIDDGVGPYPSGVVRGNAFSRSAVCQATGSGGTNPSDCTVPEYGLCKGTSVVMHGITHRMIFENNKFDETPGAFGGCYALDIVPGYAGIYEEFVDVTVRGNRFLNMGDVAVNLTACVRCLVEQNMMSWLDSTKVGNTNTGIAIGVSGNWGMGGLADAYDTQVVIRNNSIYSDTNSQYTVGIKFGTPGATAANSTGVKVNNNAIYFGPNTKSGVKCMDYGGLAITTNISSWDYNSCYRDASSTAGAAVWSNLASTPGSGSFDAHSITADPLLTARPASGNGYTTKFSSGSPVYGAGLSSACTKLGYGSKTYSGVCDVGGDQHTATGTAPLSPGRTTIQ